jgi:hypothetical protein
MSTVRWLLTMIACLIVCAEASAQLEQKPMLCMVGRSCVQLGCDTSLSPLSLDPKQMQTQLQYDQGERAI